MSEKIYFTVMRKWSEPNIKTVVTDEKIAIFLDGDDFSNILAEELFWTPCLTKGLFKKRLRSVMEKIRQAMQKETAGVAS